MTLEEATEVYKSLVVVSLALTDHNHQWTKEEKSAFNKAHRLLKRFGVDTN